MTPDCRVARSLISPSLDGELDEREAEFLATHLQGCGGCSKEKDRLEFVRSAVRIRSQERVASLDDEMIRAIAGKGRRLVRRDEWFRRGKLALTAAMSCALLLAGTSFPWREAGSGAATATEIMAGIRSASNSLAGYHARMRITETGWHEEIPSRSFDLRVWFKAPEKLRIEIEDLTDYPGTGWPRNDVSLVAGPNRWSLTEPFSCPPEVLPDCPVGSGIESSAMRNRAPFDGTTTMPTDLVLPLESVGMSPDLGVIGATQVSGRPAVEVSLSLAQARPLLDALRPGGSWAPLPAAADVRVFLDRETWFPLAIKVRDGDATLLDAVTSSLRTEGVSVDLSSPAPSRVRNAGWTDSPWTEAVHLEPADTQGLARYRAGESGGTTVLSYARGMSWLRVMYSEPRRPPPDPGEAVALASSVTGYYMPAGSRIRRSVDVYSSRRFVRVEGNLPRARLMAVARSLDIPGRVRAAKSFSEQELSNVTFTLLPSSLPAAYSYSSGSIFRAENATTVVARYRASEYEPFGDGIEVTASTGLDALPPTSIRSMVVDLDGIPARWLGETGTLEWFDGGVYRSVSVHTENLDLAFAIARGLK